MKISEQIEALETGKGIQYLLDAAFKIFRNPIVMFDTYYNLIAYTEVVTDDPLWNTLISTGTFRMAEQEFFSEERFTEDVANADKLVVMKSDKLKYDRILGNIFNSENIKVANIVMVESGLRFEPETQAAFEVLADRISAEIKNDNYYTVFGRDYHDAILRKILDGEFSDTMMYTPHVQILYDGFADYLYLAVVDLSKSSVYGGKITGFRNMMAERYPHFKFAVYSGYILALISSKYSTFPREEILENNEKFLEQNGIYTGISCGFENIYELRRHYDETVKMLKDGIAAGGGGNVFVQPGSKCD